MINKLEKDLEVLKQIYTKDSIPNSAVINMSSWKESPYAAFPNEETKCVVHSFIYSEQDCKGEVCSIRFSLEKVYNSFTSHENYLHKFWEEKIEAFENIYNIEFLMLISYVYMLNENSINREVDTATEVAAVLSFFAQHN